MKNSSLIVALSLSVMISSITLGSVLNKQEASNKIIGVWKSTAEIEGEPQVVLTIKKTGDKLEGSFVFRGLTVNGRENVTLEPLITNPSFDGTVLSFKVTFPDPDKTATEWELKLRSEHEAGLMIIKEDGNPVAEGPSFVMKRVR
jgi:hypothetical protein